MPNPDGQEREARRVVVDFLDAWRYCPVASSASAARQCLEKAADELLAALAAREEPQTGDIDDREWTAVGEQAGAARAGETMWSGPHLKPGERITVVSRYRLTAAECELRTLRHTELARLREEAEGTHDLLAHFRDDRARLTRALKWIETRDYYPPEAEECLIAIQKRARDELTDRPRTEHEKADALERELHDNGERD